MLALDRRRQSLGERYLAEDGLSMEEIAWLLAFADERGFRRAFRRWTGRSTREFRRALADPARSVTAKARGSE